MSDHFYLFAGLGSAAVSALFYGVYKNREGAIRSLQNAVEFEIGSQLRNALLASDTRSIPYGVIRGETKPQKSNEVIRSSHVADVTGVMQRVRTREHKSEWSRTTRLWHDMERTISSASSSVPFCLFRNGDCVNVMEPLSAEQLTLKVIHDKFEPVSSSVAESLVQWASGDKTKGFQTIEQMLPVGTTLTGIGEITLTDDGIKIGPPKSGLTYYLSQFTLDAIVRQLQSGKKVWKILSAIFAFGSGILFLVSLFLYFKRRRDREVELDLMRRMREEVNVLGEGEVLDQQEACVICMDRQRNVVILDCGHICCCIDCAQRVNNCPVCRRVIARLIPTFNS